ncbi:MAG TPA: biotin/lipoyl-containing protein [Acidobacteriaceae bacterium]|jgi:biotin carboxyl carrier protein|nr:biotin/lipoyl-containing protein [Acidobacteriaceae bacterium]
MKLQVEIQGQTREVEIEPGEAAGQWTIRVDGQVVEADAHIVRPGVLSLLIGGQSHRVVLDPHAEEPALLLGAERIAYGLEDPRSLKARRRHSGGDGPVTLKASMPGRVVRVLVDWGAQVEAHQAVVVIEAMKMQNELRSPKAGKVVELKVSAGDTVSAGDVLAIIA